MVLNPCLAPETKTFGLVESGLNIRTRLLNDSLEIEGEEFAVARATAILNDYVTLVREGHVFSNGDLNGLLRVVTF